MKKYLVSNYMHPADWHNTEVIGGDVAQKLPTSRP
jgi:hypothetical protein